MLNIQETQGYGALSSTERQNQHDEKKNTNNSNTSFFRGHALFFFLSCTIIASSAIGLLVITSTNDTHDMNDNVSMCPPNYRKIDVYQSTLREQNNGHKIYRLEHLSESFKKEWNLPSCILQWESTFNFGVESSGCCSHTEGFPTSFKDANSGLGKVIVNDDIEFQEILGFGGAFTEAAAVNFAQLPTDVQEKIIEAYFGDNGIHYTFGRVHINSCDFSVQSYSFDDVPNDFSLIYFDSNVTHDTLTMIPLIKRAIEASETELKIFASPWSPPAWMKVPVNGAQSMISSSYPHGVIASSEMLDTWALYISKFIDSYNKHGIPIWGITVQNEPEFAAPWEACMYNSSFEAQFIANHLGPIMRSNHPEVKIMAFDHNKDHLLSWAKEILSDEQAKDFVDGFAFHWYSGGGDRNLDGATGYTNLNRTNELLTDGKFLLASEGCNCPGVQINSSFRAKRYAHDIMQDLHNFAVGWVDWNLLLNYEGGPNHVNNNCDAPILCNEDHTNIIIQPYYYALGHFSKFILPGSKRIYSEVSGHFYGSGGSSDAINGLEVTGWICESSSRQTWTLSSDKKLVLSDSNYQVCLGSQIDSSFDGLLLVNCYDPSVGIWEFDGQNIRLQSNNDQCLQLWKMENGAQAGISTCDTSNPLQKWEVTYSGEVRISQNRLCLTAGWPFFQSISFQTPSNEIVTVVLNESDEEGVFFEITDGDNVVLSFIPPASIQTYIF